MLILKIKTPPCLTHIRKGGHLKKRFITSSQNNRTIKLYKTLLGAKVKTIAICNWIKLRLKMAMVSLWIKTLLKKLDSGI